MEKRRQEIVELVKRESEISFAELKQHFPEVSEVTLRKERVIAAKAVKLLRPNNSLFIAAGSTCAEMTKVLPDIPLQVFTDGLVTALELSKYSNIEATMIGGQINTDSVRSSGFKVFEELNKLHFDFSFLGTDAYRPDFGFVCCSAHAAALIERSDKTVVLMDSSKVDAIRAARSIPTNQVDIVVSDGGLSNATAKALSQAGVMLL